MLRDSLQAELPKMRAVFSIECVIGPLSSSEIDPIKLAGTNNHPDKPCMVITLSISEGRSGIFTTYLVPLTF